MKIRTILPILLMLTLFSCMKEDPIVENGYYFPPLQGNSWDTTSMESLGWDRSQLQNLRNYLKDTHTKSFMILVNGRIVFEEYYDGHTATTPWQWNSAGKTLVSSITGIAEEDGLLKINEKVSDYLGKKWTSAPEAKEDLINIRHLLTMTSGIDDEESQLTIPSKLLYKADAGTRWAYHNIFQKLMDVVANASNKTFDDYFNEKLASQIGMDGFWRHGLIFRIYHSSARSMARFGILIQNDGKWMDKKIVPKDFLDDARNPSQDINASYGYFWWLNGKSHFMLPGTQEVFQSTLIPTAPSDMYAAMGAEDQRLYIVPSKKMIVIRMGDAAFPLKPSFAVSGFDGELWSKIMPVIQ
ncbi:MAG: serine hydrolase [Saprospiraceae bacterium]|nr:serine hydrolase [Saprospiraceae bacterium]